MKFNLIDITIVGLVIYLIVQNKKKDAPAAAVDKPTPFSIWNQTQSRDVPDFADTRNATPTTSRDNDAGFNMLMDF